MFFLSTGYCKRSVLELFRNGQHGVHPIMRLTGQKAYCVAL
jgi:hypothetical protein